MPYRYAQTSQRVIALFLATSLGLSLALGLPGACLSLAQLVFQSIFSTTPSSTQTHLAFPIVAGLLYLSLRVPIAPPQHPTPTSRLWLRVPVPFAISLVFGYLQPGAFVFFSPDWPALLWAVVLAPLGEELLFRGWVYAFAERLYPRRFLTLTNPLPIPVWVSAIGFSLWHIQNEASWHFILFQMGYTLVLGLLLGAWRWHSGRLTGPVLAHMGLNFCSLVL